jgi:hypothetical protein
MYVCLYNVRILANARKLKGTGIAVSQQFPEEIVSVRKRLYQEMKKARDVGRKFKLVRDKLYIDGICLENPRQHKTGDGIKFQTIPKCTYFIFLNTAHYDTATHNRYQ